MEESVSMAAQAWRPLVRPRMAVAGVAGDVIGEVGDVRPADFVVDRAGSLGSAPTTPLVVRYEHIHVILADKITLDLPSSQIDELGALPLAQAPIFG